MNIIKLLWYWLTKIFQKPALADEQFGTGSVPQPFDERDYEEPMGSGAFDWSTGYDVEEDLTRVWNIPFKLRAENQNGSLSCVGQAFSLYSSIKNYVETGVWTKLSARDVYSHIYVPMGGAYMRTGAQQTLVGIVPEGVHPSYIGDNMQLPSESFMRIRLRESKVHDNVRDVTEMREYRAVTRNIDELAKAMSINHGLCLAVNGDNNGTWHTEFPKPPASRQWGHAIYAGKAKLINGKKYIGIMNSWGPVGNASAPGWQWFGEEWFTPVNNVYDGWVLSDEPNQVTNQADYMKIQKFINSPEYIDNHPMKSHSPYHTQNWAYILSSTGLNYTWGQYYDWAQANKLREQYKI